MDTTLLVHSVRELLRMSTALVVLLTSCKYAWAQPWGVGSAAACPEDRMGEMVGEYVRYGGVYRGEEESL